MEYYLRRGQGYIDQVWQFEDGAATKLGVTNPQYGPGSYFKASPGETILQAIRRQTPSWFGPNGESYFYKLDLQPGHYYPRMVRPYAPCAPNHSLFGCPGTNLERNVVAIARSQLRALTEELEKICQTIHPHESTFRTFGHSIRNLLILACTEAEAHWRGVLIANEVKQKDYNIRDYFTLCLPLKLDEYSIVFPNYPWLQPLRPYENWGKPDAQAWTLEWYTAYNAVKHNREVEFERATLRNAFEAVTACFIMMVAQFKEHSPFFQLASQPNWSPSEVYTSLGSSGWSPVPFQFVGQT